jgi:poly-gamma-glutamate capsule biosynthesis protein CapA/YwtB (metallophosphatase superfamily)
MNRREFLKISCLLPLTNPFNQEAEITFGGDTLLGGYIGSPKYGSMTRIFDTINQINVASEISEIYFKNLKRIFNQSDYTIVNFEGPIIPNKPINSLKRDMYPKQFPLGQHELSYEILRQAGVNAFSLANNHTFDYKGKIGLENTLEILDNYMGAGKGEEAYFPLQLDLNGISFDIYSVTDILEPIQMVAEKTNLGVAGLRSTSNYFKDKNLIELIKNIEEHSADFKIVNLHAGPLSGSNLNQRQKEIVDILLESGVDLIVGHHSHATQPVRTEKKYGKKQIVFYGIGNLVFGGRQGPQSKSIIPTVHFTKSLKQNSIKASYLEINPNPNTTFCPKILNKKYI